MIDNRLLYNNQNCFKEDTTLLVLNVNLEEYKKNKDFVNILLTNIYNNSDVSSIQNVLEKYIIDKNDGFILLGNLIAKSIISKDIKDKYNHLKWIDRILSANNYIYESYMYYIKEFLQDGKFKINYTKFLKEYYRYCNENPKLLVSYHFDKRSALKILKEWNNNNDYSKIIGGEWKRFYTDIFRDFAHYLILPIIEIQNYKLLIEILSCIDNFFIIDNILSFNQIRYDIEVITSLLQILNNCHAEKSIIIQFLLLNKVQEYITKLNQRVENITEEIKTIAVNLFNFINKLENKDFIYKNWFKFLTNQIIKNSNVDLSIVIIELIIKELISLNIIKDYKKELLEDKNNNSYESLLSLILLEDEPNFNKEHFQLLEKYLTDKNQYLYVNLYQVNKVFEPRFYYLSQLFIGKNIGENDWLHLWNRLYKERKRAIYPNFYKNTDSIYRSIFLIITGVSAIQYLCEDDITKASKLLNYIWEATKEIHLYLTQFYDKFIIEIVFRLVMLSEIIKEPSKKYLDYFKYNSVIITQILVSLDNNKYKLDNIKNDKQYLNSVETYINEIMDKKHVSKEYIDLCNILYKKLKS